MQDYLGEAGTDPLPAHVQVHRFRDIDIQDVLARGAMLVTDYSSTAFESAYIRRPVVYFQFDQDFFFAGGHAYRKGTWSYPDNGFGPVTAGLDDALDAVAAIAERGLDPEYAARIEKTFPLRDGQCCRRTAQAVLHVRAPADSLATR
jgi:CDP-glycerol glycerophosphotransferase (TagB/SpsB family)